MKLIHFHRLIIFTAITIASFKFIIFQPYGISAIVLSLFYNAIIECIYDESVRKSNQTKYNNYLKEKNNVI